MILIIAGSRHLTDRESIKEAITTTLQKHGWPVESIKMVLSGEAEGPDKIGAEWAGERGIPVDSHPARWDLYEDAGRVRNREMGQKATHLLAIWDGKSSGTRHMIKYMEKLKKPYIVRVPPVKVDKPRKLKYDLFA